MKKPPSKVARNRPNFFFHYCPELPIWPKIENPYQKLGLSHPLLYLSCDTKIHKVTTYVLYLKCAYH